MTSDLEPQDPRLGPPLPKRLKILWPKELKGPPGSIAYRAQSYAAGLMRAGKATPEQALERAKRWIQGVTKL